MLADLIHSGCLMYVVVESGRWCVYVVQSDGMSGSSSGASGIRSTKTVQIVVFLERWKRPKGVAPCAK